MDAAEAVIHAAMSRMDHPVLVAGDRNAPAVLLDLPARRGEAGCDHGRLGQVLHAGEEHALLGGIAHRVPAWTVRRQRLLRDRRQLVQRDAHALYESLVLPAPEPLLPP